MSFKLWAHYLCLVPGPTNYGCWRAAEEALVFAIGRNEIPDKKRFEVGRAAVQNALDEASLIDRYILTIGERMGDTNEYIADHLRWLMCIRPKLRAYVQWEVAISLGKHYRSLADRITVLWPSDVPSATFNGRDVVLAAVHRGLGQSGKPPLIVTHDWYLARAMLVTQKILRRQTCVSPQRIRRFDRRSVQWWTASDFGWLSYEPRARGHHLLHHWV